MKTRQGEFSPFLLHTVLTGDRVHAHAALQHPALAHLDAILEIQSQVAPADNLDLSGGILGAQAIESGHHLRHGGLVVLRVANLRRLQHLRLNQTVIHTLFRGTLPPS